MDMKPIGAARNFAKEFRDFLLKTNMLALALAVVLGAATTKVVNVIVTDVLGGIIKAFGQNAHGWDSLNLNVWRFSLRFGPLVNALIEFSCVAVVVFLITKAFIRNAPPPPAAPTKTCPACKEGIHPEATRCKFCTAEQPPLPPPAPAPEAPKAA